MLMVQDAEPRNCALRTVPVSVEDASMIKKVHRILESGKDVEIRKGNNGKLKVLRVFKQLEEE